MKVYLVNWEQIMDDYTDYGTIGVYQSEADARAAINNIKTSEFSPLPLVTIYETQLGSRNLVLIDKIQL